MYFTYVVRPGEAPEGRGPQLEPFWNFLVVFSLRLGFILQCIGFIGLLSCIFINEISAFAEHKDLIDRTNPSISGDSQQHFKDINIENSNLPHFNPKEEFTSESREDYLQNEEKHFGHEQGVPYMMLLSFLRARPETVGDAPVVLALFCCFCFVIGSIMAMSFQSLMDDDSSIKQSRGFRAGTKLLQQASSIAVFGWSLTLLSFWASNNYFDESWMQKQLAAGSSWLIFFTARVIDSLGLLVTAAAIFYLETYHSEGVGEFWGWFLSLCYTTAAASEVVALTLYGTIFFEVFDTIYTIVFGIALLSSFIWATTFEPLSHRYDVKLTQSALRNEYYKSKNAMAYYGPAVVNANGEIDIAAAAEQAQNVLH